MTGAASGARIANDYLLLIADPIGDVLLVLEFVGFPPNGKDHRSTVFVPPLTSVMHAPAKYLLNGPEGSLIDVARRSVIVVENYCAQDERARTGDRRFI